jgi:ferredoxin-NADP reductase
MKNVKATLVSRKIVAPEVHHLFFSTDQELEYKAGQYIILTVPTSTSSVKRLYSFAGANNHKNTFELLIKLVPGGAASEFLRSLPIGGVIEAAGPAGLFSQAQSPARKIYMVTGTGFAPVRSFLLSNDPKTNNSVLFWGMRDFSEAYMMDELLALKQASPSFSFYYCLSRQEDLALIPADLRQFFRMGHIDDVWKAEMPTLEAGDEFYLCGSRTVIESLRQLLLSSGTPKERVFFEKY